MKLTIARFDLTGAQLNAVPEDVRILFVQLAHLTNSISILQKSLYYAGKQPNDTAQRHGYVSQQWTAPLPLDKCLSKPAAI